MLLKFSANRDLSQGEIIKTIGLITRLNGDGDLMRQAHHRIQGGHFFGDDVLCQTLAGNFRDQRLRRC
jgi:hypothetical protein